MNLSKKEKPVEPKRTEIFPYIFEVFQLKHPTTLLVFFMVCLLVDIITQMFPPFISFIVMIALLPFLIYIITFLKKRFDSSNFSKKWISFPSKLDDNKKNPRYFSLIRSFVLNIFFITNFSTTLLFFSYLSLILLLSFLFPPSFVVIL